MITINILYSLSVFWFVGWIFTCGILSYPSVAKDDKWTDYVIILFLSIIMWPLFLYILLKEYEEKHDD